LKKDVKVTLTGFGTCQVQERQARKDYNPQTGEQMLIPAKKVLKFSPREGLKYSVSG
jgi:DNA-binding protein HU-beta